MSSFKIGEVAVGMKPAGIRDAYLLDGEDVVIIKPLRKRRTSYHGVTMCYIVKHVSGGTQDFYAKPEWLKKKPPSAANVGWEFSVWKPSELVSSSDTNE